MAAMTGKDRGNSLPSFIGRKAVNPTLYYDVRDRDE